MLGRSLINIRKEGKKMYISLYDLALFIIFMVILIVSGYLIAVLHRAFCVLGYVKGILSSRGEDIHQIIAGLPEVLANTNKLAVSLKGIAEQANGTFDSLQNNIIDTVDDLRDGVETFMVYAKLLADVWQAIFSRTKS